MNDSDMAGTYFVTCLRCMGHGHIVLSNGGSQFEVFSKLEAVEQARELLLAHRFSHERFPTLMSQIMDSPLPEEPPEDVVAFVTLYGESELRYAKLATPLCQSRPEQVSIESDELAEAVHAFLLRSPERHLGLQ
jgi:hypothetical protein